MDFHVEVVSDLATKGIQEVSDDELGKLEDDLAQYQVRILKTRLSRSSPTNIAHHLEGRGWHHLGARQGRASRPSHDRDS